MQESQSAPDLSEAAEALELSSQSTVSKSPKSKPTNNEQSNHISNDDAASHSSAESESDPSEALEKKDWNELEARYHQMVANINEDEKALLNEFETLVQFFDVWRQTSQVHEVDRTFKRLKTRMYHVEHSEAELEKKQQHYSQVVEAFKNALKLLEQ